MRFPFFRNNTEQAPNPEDDSKPEKTSEMISQEREALRNYRREFPFKRLMLALLLGTGVANAIHEYSNTTIDQAADQANADLKTPEKESGESESQKRRFLDLAKNDVGQFFIEFKQIKDEPFVAEALLAAAHADPEFFMDKFPLLKHDAPRDALQSAVEYAMQQDPRYLIFTDHTSNDAPELQTAFEQSQDPIIRSMDSFNKHPGSFGEKRRAVTLLQDISDGSLTPQEAIALTNNPEAWTQRLIEIHAIPDHAAAHAIDIVLEGKSKSVIADINDLHDEPDQVRFAQLRELSPSHLYTYLVYAGTDAYPSTFNGTFDRLLEGLRDQGMTGDELMKQVGDQGMRTFFQKSSEYHRLSEFLSTMSPDAQQNFVQQFVGGLETSNNLTLEGAVIADTIKTIDDPRLRETMRVGIRQGYDKAVASHNKEAEVAYGILSLVIDPGAEWIPKDRVAAYELPNQDELSVERLMNERGEIIQRYFFYNDEDGQGSFHHFLKRFESEPGWSVTKEKGVVIASKTQGERTLKIYANTPAAEVTSTSEELDVVAQAMKKAGDAPTVIVHRGHIYHNNATIAHIPESAQLVFLGSCGGYTSIASVLEKSEGAHIISTQGTGTKLVNSRLLANLDSNLLTQDMLNWNSFFAEAEQKLKGNEDFTKYVGPQDNQYARFLYTFQNALEET
jgi:hypothetical protein